jgi:hypothetical protein
MCCCCQVWLLLQWFVTERSTTVAHEGRVFE